MSILTFVTCILGCTGVVPGVINAVHRREDIADEPSRKVKVVTTLNFIASIARDIGGEHVRVVPLADPGQDPHYVIPTPNLSRLARDAELFLEVGMGLDIWSDNVIKSSGNPSIQSIDSPGRLQVSRGIAALELPDQSSRAGGDIHPQGNPHIWLDPVNAISIAENIAVRLSKLMPSHKDYFYKMLNGFRARIYEKLFGRELVKEFGEDAGEILIRKLNNGSLVPYLKKKGLDVKLKGWVGSMLPFAGMKVITYHKTYAYFAKRFGLVIVGEIEAKPGIPPQPRRKEEIVRIGRAEDVKIVITENFYPTEPAQYVAKELGARLVVNYIDVGAAANIRTYEDLIDRIVSNLTDK